MTRIFKLCHEVSEAPWITVHCTDWSEGCQLRQQIYKDCTSAATVFIPHLYTVLNIEGQILVTLQSTPNLHDIDTQICRNSLN